MRDTSSQGSQSSTAVVFPSKLKLGATFLPLDVIIQEKDLNRVHHGLPGSAFVDRFVDDPGGGFPEFREVGQVDRVQVRGETLVHRGLASGPEKSKDSP